MNAEQLLQALFDTHFVMACKESEKLKVAINNVVEQQVWPHVPELVTAWTRSIASQDVLVRGQTSDGVVAANSASLKLEQDRAEKKSYPVEYGRTGLAKDMLAWGTRVLEDAICCNCMKKEHYYSRCNEPLVTCSVCDERDNSKLHDQVLEKRAQQSLRGARGGRGRQSSRAKPGSPAERLETAAKGRRSAAIAPVFLTRWIQPTRT